MSVVAAMMELIMGSGLMVLGAFFIWQIIIGSCPRLVLIPVLAPVSSIILISCLGECEMAIGVLWGTVAINLVIMNLLALCSKQQVPSVNHWLMLLCIALGWLICFLSGRGVTVGKFSGLGLIIVSLIVWWHKFNLHKSDLTQQVKLKLHMRSRWLLIPLLLIISFGAWLIVLKYRVLTSVLAMPVGMCGVLIIAPICSAATWLGLFKKEKWQSGKLSYALSYSNALLTTFGLGVVSMMMQELHLTQSMSMVTLPWIASLVILSIVVLYLPQKTARWWSGLMVVIYLSYWLTLF